MLELADENVVGEFVFHGRCASGFRLAKWPRTCM
jgi:hypothetical protein